MKIMNDYLNKYEMWNINDIISQFHMRKQTFNDWEKKRKKYLYLLMGWNDVKYEWIVKNWMM